MQTRSSVFTTFYLHLNTATSHCYDSSVLTMLSKQPRPKPLPWSPPSHLAIFVRNLQLLSLHHHQDWPDISLRTLSPSSQNQRQRIKAVEWALYHLCATWDPEIAQDVCPPDLFSSMHARRPTRLTKRCGDTARNCVRSSLRWNRYSR